MIRRIILAIVLVGILGTTSHAPVVHAQGGMTKATMILLVNDLLNAGYFPTMYVDNGKYFVAVAVDVTGAPTAAQVNTFATNRGTVVKVTGARFE